MSRFEIAFRTVTPTFCRGRDEQAAEIRAPSLKGQLRFWYRAWQPLAVNGPADGPWSEARVMGSSGASPRMRTPAERTLTDDRRDERRRVPFGQSPFLLRIAADGSPKTVSWQEIERSSPRGSRSRVAGVRYLGFSFRPTASDRRDHRAIAEEVSFRVHNSFPREPSDEAARGLVAAWWLLGHLGGLGARARRGFGSLSIESWSWPGREELLSELPLASRASGGSAWQTALVRGLQVLESWLDPALSWPGLYPHPHLGPSAEVVVQADPAWRRHLDALEAAGQSLAIGRRSHRGPPREVDGRVSVGLPLETGKGPSKSWRPGSFRGHRIESDVHASPLHLHVGAFRGGFGLCWTRLAGPVPGLGEYRVREERSRRTLREEAPDTLGELVRSLEGRRWLFGGGR